MYSFCCNKDKGKWSSWVVGRACAVCRGPGSILGLSISNWETFFYLFAPIKLNKKTKCCDKDRHKQTQPSCSSTVCTMERLRFESCAGNFTWDKPPNLSKISNQLLFFRPYPCCSALCFTAMPKLSLAHQLAPRPRTSSSHPKIHLWIKKNGKHNT